MTGAGTATEGGPSTDSTQVVTVATPTPEKMTETVSLVQYGASTTAGARGATGGVVQHPAGRRRRASMQDALDHTKINTSLYDPTLVRQFVHVYACICAGRDYQRLETAPSASLDPAFGTVCRHASPQRKHCPLSKKNV